MVAEKTLMKLGFMNDENLLQLNEVFKNDIKLKEIHIDVYPTNPLISSSTPFMLLLRTIEKKMTVKNSGNRLVLKKVVDRYNTYFMNILFSEITECYFKGSDGYYEFILNVQNIYYRITVFN